MMNFAHSESRAAEVMIAVYPLRFAVPCHYVAQMSKQMLVLQHRQDGFWLHTKDLQACSMCRIDEER